MNVKRFNFKCFKFNLFDKKTKDSELTRSSDSSVSSDYHNQTVHCELNKIIKNDYDNLNDKIDKLYDKISNIDTRIQNYQYNIDNIITTFEYIKNRIEIIEEKLNNFNLNNLSREDIIIIKNMD